ncbi:MAG: PIN domain-containing protein [Treponema sp.]|nr:PIN domain-containing protein [Candidatus Treponema caballi]
MKILIDTNVLIDMAVERNNNHRKADIILKSCVFKRHEGYVTSHSITDFFYIVRKDLQPEEKRNWVKYIVTNLTILTEDKEAFLSALGDNDFFDLEDNLQISCAAEEDLNYIITQNLKDFASSPVPAISISEFADKYC